MEMLPAIWQQGDVPLDTDIQTIKAREFADERLTLRINFFSSNLVFFFAL